MTAEKSKEGFLEIPAKQNKLQNSDLKNNTIQSNQEELGSNDSFRNYTNEIYDGLKIYASQESISDQEAENQEFQQVILGGSAEYGSKLEGKNLNLTN